VTAGPCPGTSADQEVAAFDTEHPAAAHATDWVPARCGTARGWFSLTRYRLGGSCFWLHNGFAKEKEGGMSSKKYKLTVEVVMPGKPPVKLGVYLERQGLV
jgi:hypothetical protein